MREPQGEEHPHDRAIGVEVSAVDPHTKPLVERADRERGGRHPAVRRLGNLLGERAGIQQRCRDSDSYG
jgi:hypothetical protein